jgi:uncharacterized membrane protein YjjB (DUF3815 family)
MMMDVLKIVELALWTGIAGIGFGILFNIPRKAILTVFILGFGVGLIKSILLKLGVNIIISSFIAALFVGVFSIPLAHKIHQPPVVFSIPSVIPMIPGYFAYKTVLAMMNFTFMEVETEKRLELLDAIFSNGFTMLFVLISLTLGISLPLMLMRKSTVKKTDTRL